MKIMTFPDHTFEEEGLFSFTILPGTFVNGSNSVVFRIYNNPLSRTEIRSEWYYTIDQDSNILIGNENSPLITESLEYSITEYVNNNYSSDDELGFLLLLGAIGGGIALSYFYIKRKDEYIYLTANTEK